MQKSININIYVFVRKSQQYLWEDTQETSSSGHLQRRLQRVKEQQTNKCLKKKK